MSAAAIRAFKRNRGEWYSFFARRLRSSGAKITYVEMFRLDAERYRGHARGIVSQLVVRRLNDNGNNLAKALEGIFPDDEVTTIRLAQSGSNERLVTMLFGLSRRIKLLKAIRRMWTLELTAVWVMLTLAMAVLTVAPPVLANFLLNTFDNVPVKSWAKEARWVLSYADWLKHWAVPLFSVIGLGAYLIVRSLTRLTGPRREWLDEHVGLYRMFRDLRSVNFLSQMALLTERKSSGGGTLEDAIDTLRMNSHDAWWRWRYQQILDKMHGGVNSAAEAFNTRLMPLEAYWFFSEVSSVSGESDAFQETMAWIEETFLDRFRSGLALVRWVMVAISVVIMFSFLGFSYYLQSAQLDALQKYSKRR
jgi:type II secretory pathway component PulF